LNARRFAGSVGTILFDDEPLTLNDVRGADR